MNLSKYDEKHVRIADIYGAVFTGVADYFDACYCQHEYGVNEDAVMLEPIRNA